VLLILVRILMCRAPLFDDSIRYEYDTTDMNNNKSCHYHSVSFLSFPRCIKIFVEDTPVKVLTLLLISLSFLSELL